MVAKVEAIADFPVLSNKKELMRFLDMVSYHRRLCMNVSVIVELMTNLLQRNQLFVWSDDCQMAFWGNINV